MEKIVALDLFAGTGWGVACKRLGIEEGGVELMDEAVATRTANGMVTLYRDVWDGLLLDAESHALLYGEYNLLIASPPCQTFSAAGKGAGRKALNEVLEAIDQRAYMNPEALLAFGEAHDIRTALVLSPLAYIWRDRPQLVALEQVPTVQPVWEAYAEVMRQWGYSVETRILNAEQYGVPQTRRRAILVANLGGPVALPTPTHSRYYPRTPEKLDPGVLKWVTMAEALGWGRTDAPSHTVTGGVHGPTDRWASGGNNVRKAMDAAIGGPNWKPNPSPRPVDGRTQYADRFDVEEVATIQTYPADTGWGFTNRPAMTVTGHGLLTRSPTGQKKAVVEAAEAGEYRFRPPYTSETAEREDYQPQDSGYLSMSEKYHGDAVNCIPEENAIPQSYPAELRQPIQDWKWKDAPATTVAGDPRITAREHHYHGEQSKTSLRLEQEEAHVLQTFPQEPPFIWCGSKSKVFLQIGNAVPPLLAQHILAALLESREAGELI